MYKQILLLVLFAYVTLGQSVKCPSNFGTVINKDCSKLWNCVWGKPFKMKTCKAGLIFNRKNKVCVRKGGVHDDCDVCKANPCKNGEQCFTKADGISFYCKCHPTHTGTTCDKVVKSFKIEDECKRNPSAIVPHPTECQLFYNCSNAYKYVPRFFKQYLHECSYSMLFSAASLKCEDFRTVHCGTRNEHKSGCSYLRNQCPRSHCIPCSWYYPSCVGKKDGLYEHGSKKGPFFMKCEKERTVKTGQCPSDPATGRPLRVSHGSCSKLME